MLSWLNLQKPYHIIIFEQAELWFEGSKKALDVMWLTTEVTDQEVLNFGTFSSVEAEVSEVKDLEATAQPLQCKTEEMDGWMFVVTDNG